MVKPFEFSKLPLIYFGSGKLKLLPGLIKKSGDEIILVSNKKSFTETSIALELYDDLAKTGIRHHQVSIQGEPSPEIIDNVVSKYGTSKIDAVVSIGGGSVIDAGKAVSAMLFMDESVKTYLEGVGTLQHPGTKIPFIAVPTTSGTGSEVTKNAVLSRTGINGFKKSLRHDNFVPDIALVDPDLTVSCPSDVTAASGMDCFSQLTESFLSGKSCDFTDELAIRGIKEIKSCLEKSFTDGSDIKARTGMSFAALTSGICLANAGLGVVHGFASSIGGLFDIPHGIICGTLMASANEVTVRNLRKEKSKPEALKKYADLGRIFTGSYNNSDDYYIDGFIDYLKYLTEFFQLPRLNKFGIKAADVEEICKLTELKNNPIKLNGDDLSEILSFRI